MGACMVTTMPNIDIIYQHPDFLVISKPIAVTMHYADGDIALLPLLIQNGFTDLSLVHRLDTDTSGLMILARNRNATVSFATLFEQRKIEKYYIAISDNKPAKKQGHILGDMKKVRNGSYALTRENTNPAYTQFFSRSLNIESAKPHRLFVLKPFTGKTHQLRVALKSLGAPIVGDKRYSKTQSDRMYLHAWGIRFEYLGEHFQFIHAPTDGELFNSRCFKQSLAELPEPWNYAWPDSKQPGRRND